MAARSVLLGMLALLSLGTAIPAQGGDWIGEFFSSIARDTKRNNCWPQPFVAPDRHDARAPFATMVNNGWRRQNMLGDHHFVEQTGALTEAGQLKVRWVLTEAPAQHRILYVHRANDLEETSKRVDAVQQLVAQSVRVGALPPVLETDIPSRGWPASQVDIIGRKFESSTPDPRLPASSTNSSE